MKMKIEMSAGQECPENMESELEAIKLCREILKKAKGRKAQGAEVYMTSSESTSIEIKDQRVDSFELAKDRGIGLRVMVDGACGFSYCNDFNSDSINKLIDKAISSARNSTPDEFRGFSEAVERYPQVNCFDEKLSEISIEEKIEKTRFAEKTGRDFDKRIINVRKCSFDDTQYEVAILNTKGLEYTNRGTYCSSSITLIAQENNVMETGWEIDSSRWFKNLDFEMVGREAARRAVEMLGATSVETKKVPVLLDPYVAMEFLSIFASSLSADNVQKGKSMLSGKTGESVAAKQISIVDNGLLPEGLASAPADGEGVPMQRTVLVENGVLRGFLYDIYTAKKDDTVSTGNGFRGGFKDTPRVSVSNFYIEKGNISQEEIVSEIDDGFLIREAMGVHTANPISGDFSLGVSGLWIKGGKISFPVRGVVISGNIMDLFRSVKKVGSDLRFYGRIGAPTLMIEEMSVSGKG